MTEKIRVVAEYMGATPKQRINVFDVALDGFVFPVKPDHKMETFYIDADSLEYHTSIEWLYPVAGKVVAELADIALNKSGEDAQKLYTVHAEIEYANNTFDVSQLFEATFQGIEIINKFKSEKNG